MIFTRAARREFLAAQNWYEKEALGLGRNFRDEVGAAVERIAENPLNYPVVYKNIRRALLRRFPYAILFVADPEDALTVIACFHGSRDPVRWQKRLT